ncbi:hypothetical protein FNV43_RR01760 [Rhamnella rubrinervis]|uniref:FLZ-type domain-containing protein n=1 Tax=Rhamnella rubrinervis TaxID=2594499 RepID=A0A8K0MT99_9ROSA|nr:hypothetical protein FNV43_RR01760 [Rhamnella rubrinervis]
MSSSSKRSKIARSSSQGEIGLLDHAQQIEPEWVPKRSNYWETFQESTAPKPDVQRTTMAGYRGKQKAVRSRGRSVLTINSPPPEESNGSDELCGFLKKCAWCKFDIDADVFMYGDFGAFCSFKCRNYQLRSDGYNIGNALDDTPTAQNVLQKNGNGNNIRSRKG